MHTHSTTHKCTCIRAQTCKHRSTFHAPALTRSFTRIASFHFMGVHSTDSRLHSRAASSTHSTQSSELHGSTPSSIFSPTPPPPLWLQVSGSRAAVVVELSKFHSKRSRPFVFRVLKISTIRFLRSGLGSFPSSNHVQYFRS